MASNISQEFTNLIIKITAIIQVNSILLRISPQRINIPVHISKKTNPASKKIISFIMQLFDE